MTFLNWPNARTLDEFVFGGLSGHFGVFGEQRGCGVEVTCCERTEEGE
jgi:hypothetical protein